MNSEKKVKFDMLYDEIYDLPKKNTGLTTILEEFDKSEEIDLKKDDGVEISEIKKDGEIEIDENFLVNLINNFTDYYKKIKQKSTNFTLFDGINTTDPTSTNGALEEFYGKMIEYKTYQKHNPDYIKIYNISEIIHKSDMEIYGLLNNGKLICKSTSLFSILIELTNIQYENIIRKNKSQFNIIVLD
jgi:hypothetical protein